MNNNTEAKGSSVFYRLVDARAAKLMLQAASLGEPSIRVQIYDPTQTEDALQAAHLLRHGAGFGKDNQPLFYGYNRTKNQVLFGLIGVIPASAETWQANIDDMARIGAYVARLEVDGSGDLGTFNSRVAELAASSSQQAN